MEAATENTEKGDEEDEGGEMISSHDRAARWLKKLQDEGYTKSSETKIDSILIASVEAVITETEKAVIEQAAKIAEDHEENHNANDLDDGTGTVTFYGDEIARKIRAMKMTKGEGER